MANQPPEPLKADEYIVVTGWDPGGYVQANQNLTRSVCVQILDGWRPQGGVTHTIGQVHPILGPEHIFSQGMVRDHRDGRQGGDHTPEYKQAMGRWDDEIEQGHAEVIRLEAKLKKMRDLA